MTHLELRRKFLDFWKAKNHVEIPGSSLIPSEIDSTVLFTTAGMHPLVPYLLGQPHPEGKRLVAVQKCLRTDDIDEVGDAFHHTFFEMLGNWSLGDYFKKEAIEWSYEFLTKDLELDPNRLFITCFAGDKDALKDELSAQIWKSLGIPEERIFFYPKKDNWWGPAGKTGPCGPDTEMFYDVTLKSHGPDCRPGCTCGRFSEIWNDVFMEYNKVAEGKFEKLPRPNVDTGMGVERTLAVVNGLNDDYLTELWKPAIEKIAELSGKKYEENLKPFRVLADHTRAAVFAISDGVRPSNKERGYILRRLIRRTVLQTRTLEISNSQETILELARVFINLMSTIYPELKLNKEVIEQVLSDEVAKFELALTQGAKEIKQGEINRFVKLAVDEIAWLQKTVNFITDNRFLNNIRLLFTKTGVIDTYLVDNQKQLIHELIDTVKSFGFTDSFLLGDQQKERIIVTEEGKKRIEEILNYFGTNKITLNSTWAFRFVSTFGVPSEVLEDLAKENGISVDLSDLPKLTKAHQKLSRSASTGMFKGGLADHSEIVTKYHTATHLLQAALRKVLGDHVHQEGSNITAERLRFDFSQPTKLTLEQVAAVEGLVNEQIDANLPQKKETTTYDDAIKSGALAFFKERYPEKVTVYSFGDFSREICGGPHVEKTGVLGRFKITREEAVSSGIRRIYAVLA